MPNNVVLCDCGVELPRREHDGDAGADLRSAVDFSLRPGERKTVGTGARFALPAECFGDVTGRSGLAARFGIHVFRGIVDSGYTGEVRVTLVNLGDRTVRFAKGDRIAQMVVCRYVPATYERCGSVEDAAVMDGRGGDGFGSTGR